jgi:hypothetical protein
MRARYDRYSTPRMGCHIMSYIIRGSETPSRWPIDRDSLIDDTMTMQVSHLQPNTHASILSSLTTPKSLLGTYISPPCTDRRLGHLLLRPRPHLLLPRRKTPPPIPTARRGPPRPAPQVTTQLARSLRRALPRRHHHRNPAHAPARPDGPDPRNARPAVRPADKDRPLLGPRRNDAVDPDVEHPARQALL